MTLVAFRDLMEEAERARYAVGYFESWNLESLQAVADAAEETRSPVILGFSGIYLPDPGRVARENLDVYAALAAEMGRQLTVPCCVLFNESPYIDWVLRAIELRFGLVMFSDETLSYGDQTAQVTRVAAAAHPAGVAVEAELAALPGVGGELTEMPAAVGLTDPALARIFVERTGVDALAVNIGQAHLHGRSVVRLALGQLASLRAAVGVPLVLHGATSVHRQDLVDAVALGIRKINVGSVLKRTYFEGVRRACAAVADGYNPYDVAGSGLPSDVLTSGRVAMQPVVADLMRLFGSAGHSS
jgi:fructose/tagatose bisphosphate aldolase